jgi:hypothetical protein
MSYGQDGRDVLGSTLTSVLSNVTHAIDDGALDATDSRNSYAVHVVRN